MFARIFLVACLVFGFSVPANSQHPRKQWQRDKQQKEPPMEKFATVGTVEGIVPGKIFITTVSNQNWIIWLQPTTIIHVTGTAEADFIRAGHFIKFTAEVSRRGNIKEKIDNLTITTPTEFDPLGVWPEGMAGAPGEAVQDNFGDNQPGTPGKTPPTAIYTIHGQITRCQKGKLTVRTPRGTFKIELSEAPSIQVDFADYTCAKKGDKISITKGQMPKMNPMMPQPKIGQAKAGELTIELSEPLIGPRKKSKPGRNTSAE